MTNKLTPEEQTRLLRTEALSYGATDIQAMNHRVAGLGFALPPIWQRPAQSPNARPLYRSGADHVLLN